MKVCFITDHPFWEDNGIFYSGGGLPCSVWERYVLDDVDLLVVGRNSLKPNVTLSSAPRVSFRLSEIYRNPMDAIFKFYPLKKEIQGFIEGADRVIIRLPSWLGLIAQQICTEKKIPFATEVVADAYDSYHNYGNLKGLLFAPLYHRLNKHAISKSQYTLYVTQEYLQKRYPNNNLTIGCTDSEIEAVDLEVLQRRLSKIDKQSSEIICGQIGNISVKYKGYHIMIKAMSHLKKQGLNIRYHIVGGGSPDYVLATAKKYGVEDQIRIVGKLSHEDIADFIDSLDIYVHPSFQEGLPRVVVEAISRGCPCLTSNIAGTPELIESQYVHKTGDADKLSKDILLLANNPQIMKAIAERNFIHAKGYYSSILNSRRRDFFNKFYNQI